MTADTVAIPLSRNAMRVLVSAASEAVGYYDDERESGCAPSLEDSELLDASLNDIFDQRVEPYVWEVPRRLLPQVRVLIPACLAIHDEEEIQIRTMETVADFEAAQVELLALLKAYDA